MLAALSLGFLWLLAQLMTSEAFFLGLGVHTAGTAMALILFAQVMSVFTYPFAGVLGALAQARIRG